MSISLLAVQGSAEFHAPGPADFELPPVFEVGGLGVTKPILIIVIGTFLLGLFLLLSARRVGLVPGRVQFVVEGVYTFVRNGIAADAIGREGIKYVPYLFTLFSFIAVLNVSGIIPFVQFPATSKIAIPMGLAIISWVVFNYVGIKRQGFGGYFRAMMLPPGVPKAIYPLLAPLEFLSTVVIRPFTLTLRLTLNMFAGHLVLLIAAFGAEFLLVEMRGVIGYSFGGVTFLFGVLLTLFEGFIQLLQAYVFTLLTAIYIGGALVHEH